IGRYDELVHRRLRKVLAHQGELLAGIAPPLPDVRRGQPTTHQRQVGGRHRDKLVTWHHSFSIVTLRLVETQMSAAMSIALGTIASASSGPSIIARAAASA